MRKANNQKKRQEPDHRDFCRSNVAFMLNVMGSHWKAGYNIAKAIYNNLQKRHSLFLRLIAQNREEQQGFCFCIFFFTHLLFYPLLGENQVVLTSQNNFSS